MKLHMVVSAEFRNNLDCFAFKNKRIGLLDDGFNASAVSELRLKQKRERERETNSPSDFYRTYLQTL